SKPRRISSSIAAVRVNRPFWCWYSSTCRSKFSGRRRSIRWVRGRSRSIKSPPPCILMEDQIQSKYGVRYFHVHPRTIIKPPFSSRDPVAHIRQSRKTPFGKSVTCFLSKSQRVTFAYREPSPLLAGRLTREGIFMGNLIRGWKKDEF